MRVFDHPRFALRPRPVSRLPGSPAGGAAEAVLLLPQRICRVLPPGLPRLRRGLRAHVRQDRHLGGLGAPVRRRDQRHDRKDIHLQPGALFSRLSSRAECALSHNPSHVKQQRAPAPISLRIIRSTQDTGEVTEHAADGTRLRKLASFGTATLKDDAGVRGIAVRTRTRIRTDCPSP